MEFLGKFRNGYLFFLILGFLRWIFNEDDDNKMIVLLELWDYEERFIFFEIKN